MMHRALFLALALSCAPLVANAKDEVVLRSGKSGQVEVLETTESSVKVTATRSDGAKVTATLRAGDLDPHNFYTLRRKHMEKTAQNHVALAKWCLDNDLVNQAKVQADAARRLDNAYVEKLLGDPTLRAKIDGKLFDYAKRMVAKGKFAEAERWLRPLIEREPASKFAEQAMALAKEIEKEKLFERAAKERKRDDAIAAKLDEETRKTAEASARQLAPIRRAQAKAQQLNSAALREKGTKAKRLNDQAAQLLQTGLNTIDSLRKKKAAGPELDRLEGEIAAELIQTYIAAGRVSLGRGAYSQAEVYGRKALQVDSNSADATHFLDQINIARALDRGDDDGSRRRPGRPIRPR